MEEGPPTDMKRVDELSTRPPSRVAGAAGRIKGVGDTRGARGGGHCSGESGGQHGYISVRP